MADGAAPEGGTPTRPVLARACKRRCHADGEDGAGAGPAADQQQQGLAEGEAPASSSRRQRAKKDPSAASSREEVQGSGWSSTKFLAFLEQRVKSRHEKVASLVARLEEQGESMATVLQRHCDEGLEFQSQRGLRFDTLEMLEALQEWGASHVLVDVKRKASLATQALPRDPLHDVEAKFAKLQQELDSVAVDGGAVEQCRLAKENVRVDAEARRAEARNAAHKASQVMEGASFLANQLRTRLRKADAHRRDHEQRIEELEQELQQAQEQYQRACQEVQQLETRAVEAERKAEEAAVEEQNQSNLVTLATKEISQVEEALAQLQRRLTDATDSVNVLDQAIDKQLVAMEPKSLAWTADDVAVWLRRFSGGEYGVHSLLFHERGITGKVLPTLTPEDLVDLGIRNLGKRRTLLDAIGRLRLRAIAELGAPAERPPPELICPITQECVREPVAIAGDEQGQAYERQAIEEWFAQGNETVPGTGVRLQTVADLQLLPLRALARQAQQWHRQRQQAGSG